MSAPGRARDDAFATAPPEACERVLSAHAAAEPQPVVQEGVNALIRPETNASDALPAPSAVEECAHEHARLLTDFEEDGLVSLPFTFTHQAATATSVTLP